jgi:transport and Golgi organization protein 2
MCTAILGLGPDGTVLLAGIRDEFIQRAWLPPARHWPDRPTLIGGRDQLAGGTWLAADPVTPRVACILNGRGHPAPAGLRRSRGELPLRAAAAEPLADLAAFDPFLLLVAEPGRAELLNWDGGRFTHRTLDPGLHLLVNSGLAGDLRPDAGEHETERIGHFQPRLAAVPFPQPKPGAPADSAWDPWLPLLNGDGLRPGDPRALIVRRDLGDGRIWGTTSISLIALTPEGLRYDFTARPGDPAAWYPVPIG